MYLLSIESCNGSTIKQVIYLWLKCEENPEPYPVIASIVSDFHETKFSQVLHHIFSGS